MCLHSAALLKSHVYVRKIITEQISVMAEALDFIENEKNKNVIKCKRK